MGGQLVVAEVGEPGARGDDQAVVRDLDRRAVGALGTNHPRLQIEAGDLRQHHRRVALVAEDVPQRRRDLPFGEDAGRDLIEQRLEQVVGLAIDERDVDRRPAERARREQSAEAAAHDHHAVARRPLLTGHDDAFLHALLQSIALVEHEQQHQRRHGGHARDQEHDEQPAERARGAGRVGDRQRARQHERVLGDAPAGEQRHHRARGQDARAAGGAPGEQDHRRDAADPRDDDEREPLAHEAVEHDRRVGAQDEQADDGDEPGGDAAADRPPPEIALEPVVERPARVDDQEHRRQERRARHRQHADQDRRRPEPRAARDPARRRWRRSSRPGRTAS